MATNPTSEPASRPVRVRTRPNYSDTQRRPNYVTGKPKRKRNPTGSMAPATSLVKKIRTSEEFLSSSSADVLMADTVPMVNMPNDGPKVLFLTSTFTSY